MARTSILALLLLAPALHAQTARDLFALQDVGEIQLSPDGRTVLFTVSTRDPAANRTTTRLMKITSSGGEPAAVSGVPEGAGTLRWSPDGARVAFIAARSGKSAIWVLDWASGALTRVCDYGRSNSFLSKAGNPLAWSPDGTRLAFAGTMEPEPPAADPVVITRIQYKGRTALSDNRRTHIYVVSASGGAPRVLTAGPHDEHSIAWGGDGAEIVFLSNREPDPDARLNYDIFAVNVARGAVRQITRTPGVEMEPAISPDGARIAYTATRRNLTTIDSVAEDAHLWIVPAAGGPGREINAALDRRTSAPQWSPDGKWIYHTAGDRGKTVLYRVSPEGGRPEAVVDRNAQVGPFAIARDGTVVFGLTDPATPREIFRLAQPPSQLTHLNTRTVAAWDLVRPESVTFRSFDGVQVQGWFYPAHPRQTRSPMILSIHGGPHGMHGWAFNGGYQVNAARGYATLAINPRGSSGYGQKFSDGCVGNWGGGDYRDLMAGVDFVLQAHPEIDPERLGVMGGSYGGFMTNWVITQTPRFKAAVAIASLSNLVSFYATSLYQDLVHAEFNGFPWEGDNFALLWRWSPLRDVRKAVTPTLFLHGERDNDVHITQAEEMYTALRQRGIPTVLVRYPREGHGFREPKHVLDSAERALEWMDRYLKP